MYEVRMSSLPSWHYFLEETELGTEKLPKRVQVVLILPLKIQEFLIFQHPSQEYHQQKM